MNQEVKDFLSKVGIKIVEPYLVETTIGYDLLCIAEDASTTDVYLKKLLCIDGGSATRWVLATSVTPIKPKSRSIEDGLVEGDIIIDIGTQGECKVLMANQYCVILSRGNDFDKTFGNIYTYSELIGMGYTLKQ